MTNRLYFGPPGDSAEYWLPRDYNAWDASWAAHLGQEPAPIRISDDGRVSEAHEAKPERKARRDEAMAYVKSYSGSWGLILDLRSDRRWGTKHFRLSDKQIDVILKAKARDAERMSNRDPRQDDILAAAAAAAEARNEPAPDFVVSIVAQGMNRPLSAKQLAALERYANERPAPVKGEANGVEDAVVEDGMYVHDDVIYKVQEARNGSMRLYAKRLVVEDGKVRFEYAPGAIRDLRASERMSLDDAAAFGHLYGVCVKCGRDLTDEESIAAGIGPVCARKGFAE